MNFKIKNDNCFIVKVNTSYYLINNKNQLNKIKEILLLIKKRYGINIYGFYDVDIYHVKNILTVLLFKKKDNDELFYNSVDLKIKNHKLDLKIVIDDFELFKNKRIRKKDIYKICEHYSINKLNLLYQ